MEFTQILYAKESRVATVTLNRPEKLNAYSETMIHEMLAALADARDDDEIRAVIMLVVVTLLPFAPVVLMFVPVKQVMDEILKLLV